MNYQKVHDSIISIARARIRPQSYSERHHVVPKSLGGTDSNENLVWLTAREHYIVHWLLYKIYRTKEMAFAWYRMTHGKRSVGRYTSHSFAYAKLARSKAMSDLFKGRRLSDEMRQKLSAAKKGRTYAEIGRPTSPLLGRPISDLHKQRVSQTSKGRKHSEAAKEKFRLSKIGPLNPQYGKTPSEETRAKISESLRRKLRELKKDTE